MTYMINVYGYDHVDSSPSRIVLVYIDSRKNFFLDVRDYEYLVGYINENGRVQDTFFDSFLFLGIVAPSGGSYETGTATSSDWKWFLDTILGPDGQIDKLIKAHKNICRILGKFNVIKVIIMIPRPSPDLGYEERINLVKWYVNNTINSFRKIKYDKIRLVGFYWMSESVSKNDVKLVKNVSKIIHSKELFFYWIPYYNAKGIDSWRSLGFDYVMLQPNFAFYDVGLERFRDVDKRIRALGIGVEMELPLYKRNPRLEDWKQSFILYLDASIKYNWSNLPLISYYYGNDFIKMGKNSSLRTYYKFVYDHVTGNLTKKELEPYVRIALETYQRKRSLIYIVIGVPLVILLIALCIIYKYIKKGYG